VSTSESKNKHTQSTKQGNLYHLRSNDYDDDDDDDDDNRMVIM
jgi:hypothetical protein